MSVDPRARRNIPFDLMAEGFARLAHHLIIEFVPKEDSQAQRRLIRCADVFDQHHQEESQRSVNARYGVLECRPVKRTIRTLSLMERV